jgi:hypothetical protein
MNKEEAEELYIESLDKALPHRDAEKLSAAMAANPEWTSSLTAHKVVRDVLQRRGQTSFGPYFAAKVIHRIQNTGVMIDRQLFGMFRKLQLAALGIVVALVILNLVFAEQKTWKSVLGVETETTAVEDEPAPFDFSDILSNP